MSDQAGPIEELVQYKKAVLLDERRDSRIRSSIENTLEFFSQRRSFFLRKFDSSNAIQDPTTITTANDFQDFSEKMTYPQTAYPGAYNESPVLGRQLMYEKDIEVQSIVSLDQKKEVEPPQDVSLRGRLKHFTLAWYAMTMSTGGVAFVLSVLPNRFDGLTALGTAIFVFNLFLFTSVTLAMITRFMMHPGTLTHSLTNPHEGFFFATFWLTLATMLTNSTAYGIPNTGPWLITALRIAFWVYTVCATLVAILYYHVLFTVKALVITNVLPGWVLPIFPAMLVGTLASAISKTQPAEHALPMLIAGLSFQGLGMMVAIAMYGIYFGRLMTSGLPADMSRPAMFIAVGPPSFTALAFIGMAQDVTTTGIFTGYTKLAGIENQNIISDVLQLLALLISIFLWTLAFWFFGIALTASIEAVHRNDFHLNWYAYVFPNVGFTIATIKIGERLESDGIKLVGTAMGTVLFFLWILIMGCHIKAVVTHQICWPGKDEDAH
jgi:C4-dicarboxylate transporter/malic acid transport protein